MTKAVLLFGMLLTSTTAMAGDITPSIDVPAAVHNATDGKVTAKTVRQGMRAVNRTAGKVSLSKMIDRIDGKNGGKAKNPVQRWLRKTKRKLRGVTVGEVISAVDGIPGSAGAS